MCLWHIQILSQYIFSFEINNILYLPKSQENYDGSGTEKGSEIQFLFLSDISALCQKYLHKSDLFFLGHLQWRWNQITTTQSLTYTPLIMYLLLEYRNTPSKENKECPVLSTSFFCKQQWSLIKTKRISFYSYGLFRSVTRTELNH